MKTIVSYDTKQQAPTEEYSAFDQAYDYFNAELFEGRLPLCMITLNRKANTAGYFSPERFNSRQADDLTDEIALNPDGFEGRTDREVLSTLVHEMAHLWQQHFGAPSRGRYHNHEWAAKMDSLGLTPSSTGEPGGKRTGQRMSHYIIDGGPFDASCRALLSTGFKLTWQSKRTGNGDKVTKKDKIKYTCPDCGVNAWGKPGLHLICGECQQRLLSDDEPVKQKSPTADDAPKVVSIDDLPDLAGEPEQLRAQIRCHLQGLAGREETRKAQEIVETVIGEYLFEYGLSFDFHDGEWVFMDNDTEDDDAVVEDGSAEDWADAIVQAYGKLHAAWENSDKPKK